MDFNLILMSNRLKILHYRFNYRIKRNVFDFRQLSRLGKLQKIGNKRRKPIHIRFHRLHKLVIFFLLTLFLLEYVKPRAKHRKRRSQLMSRAHRKTTLHCKCFTQLAGHLIKRLNQLLNLFATALDLNGARKAVRSKLTHMRRKLLDRLGVMTCQKISGTAPRNDYENQNDQRIRQD